MRREKEIRGVKHVFSPHCYQNGKYRIELEVGDLRDLEKMVKSRVLSGEKIVAVRMKSDLGSGPSMVPISEVV